MPNINDVVNEPFKKQVAALKQANEELRHRLEESKSRLDLDRVNLQAKVQVQQAQLLKLLKAEGKVAEHLAEVKMAVQALDPLPRVSFNRAKKEKTPIIAVLQRTDYHIGEMNDLKGTDGWGEFNWAIAQDRVLGQLTPNFLEWIDTQRNGYNIKDLVILDTGDFVSGDIHPELRVTNEFPLPVQTAKAGQLLAQMTAELAPHFESVRVHQIGSDNHSRLTKKPQAAQKSLNSMSYLVYEIHNALTAKLKNVTCIRAEGIKELVTIGAYRFLCEHGDSVKSWMSLPAYGIEREHAREAKRRMFGDKGFHHILMGHFHQAFFGDLIMGGCLGGTTAFDNQCGRVSPPTQISFLVGKRGAFGYVPWRLK
jgi:hypothetical protein